jgi:hemolysin III
MTGKPLLRGHFHQAAFFTACGACLLLIAKSDTNLSLIAAIIYSFSLIFLLGTSALYHRINWQPQARQMMKRLDHCAIYILIAGTFTPVCLLALGDESGRQLLMTIWSIAVLGVIQSLFFVNAPKWLSAILYVVAGYMILPYMGELKDKVNLTLLIGGGVIYTVGALTYALKRPNFRPMIFGYHEVFHVLVIVGAAFHFVLVYQLI